MQVCPVCGDDLADHEYAAYGRHEDEWVEAQPCGPDETQDAITAAVLLELLVAA